MEFLKNHLEKLILAITLLGLMTTAAMIWKRIDQTHQDKKTILPSPRPPPELKVTELIEARDRTLHPPQWTKTEQTPPMFVSVPRWWEKVNGKLTLKSGKEGPSDPRELCKGIPRQWFKDNGLDPNDLSICDKDSDEDGWTNAEEYHYKTNPKDMKSFPLPPDYLIFLSSIQNKFFLRFLGYITAKDGTKTFEINVNAFEHTFFVHKGEQIKDETRTENYWVDDFQEAYEYRWVTSMNASNRVEISHLIIHRGGEEKDPIVLTYRQTTIGKQLKAKILNKLNSKDNKPMELGKGDQFEVHAQTYKVVDIKNDGVLISDSQNQEFKIVPPKTGDEGEGK